jgi:nucleoside 2-deoxyribosyltransferase
MKIYIASSWKNKENVQIMAKYLRGYGCTVDDFTDDSQGRFIFSLEDLENILDTDRVQPSSYYGRVIKAMNHEMSQRAFQQDKKMIEWADVLILLLPCGKSAHMELGYAKGIGKKIIIFSHNGFTMDDFEVMYGFADLITYSISEVFEKLREWSSD